MDNPTILTMTKQWKVLSHLSSAKSTLHLLLATSLSFLFTILAVSLISQFPADQKQPETETVREHHLVQVQGDLGGRAADVPIDSLS